MCSSDLNALPLELFDNTEYECRPIDEWIALGEPTDEGTLFLPDEPGQRMASRKHWLAFTTRAKGTLVIDTGAARAILEGGRSLLPAGVVEVRGEFGIGDTVSCVDQAGRELARGLAAYPSSATDASRASAARSRSS